MDTSDSPITDFRAARFDWTHARAFLVTAETGSFSAAARALNMSQPTLGRQVAAFEAELGVTLFDRIPRGLALTPAGLDLLPHIRVMGAAATQAARVASGQATTLEGSVTLSVSEIVAAYYLAPVLNALRRSAPRLQIEVLVSNEASDLRRREADVAIRSFRPTQPDLIGRKLRSEAVYLYAAKDYAATLGPDPVHADLSQADFIGYDTGPRLRAALSELGLEVAERQFMRLSNSHLVVADMVRSGFGVGILPERVAAQMGGLVRVGAYPPILYDLWAVAHRELRTSARIRALFDSLVQYITM